MTLARGGCFIQRAPRPAPLLWLQVLRRAGELLIGHLGVPRALRRLHALARAPRHVATRASGRRARVVGTRGAAAGGPSG